MKNRTAILVVVGLSLFLASSTLPSYGIEIIEDKTSATDCDSVFTIPENVTVYVTGVSACNIVDCTSGCTLGEKKRYSRFVYSGNTAYEIECIGTDLGLLGVHCTCSSVSYATK